MEVLYEANQQWSKRPDDERHESLPAMRDACAGYAASAKVATVPFESVRVEAVNTDVHLVGRTGVPAKLTHYAFGQLCTTAKTPPGFMRELPATLATQVINHRLKEVKDERTDRQILFHANGSLIVRAITSEIYDRIWNHELVDRVLIPLGNEGWRTPPAMPARPGQKGTRVATEADVMPGSRIKVGDTIAPAGLYASDHDMFAFMIDTLNTIQAGEATLYRGFFLRNSEVGDGALWAKQFKFVDVCGNHFVWGATDVFEMSIAHLSKNPGETLRKGAAKLSVMLKEYSASSSADDEAAIKRAMRKEIAATKDEVIDAVLKFAKQRSLGSMNTKTVNAAFEAATEHEGWYGNPRSVWGMVQGLTEVSQRTTYTDDRNHADTQAARLMEMAS